MLTFPICHASASGSFDPWFANGNADISHYFGADATVYWRPGDFASGNVVGSDSQALVPVTTPHYEQALTGAAGDPLGVGFDQATTDSFDGPDTSYLDITTGDFAVLLTMNLSAMATNQRFLGKYSVTTYGWDFRASNTHASNGGVRLYTRDSGGLSYRTVSYAPVGLVYAFGWRLAGTQVGLRCSYGTPHIDTDLTTNLTNNRRFTFGQNAGACAGFVLGPTAMWTGAAVATVVSNSAGMESWATQAGIT